MALFLTSDRQSLCISSWPQALWRVASQGAAYAIKPMHSRFRRLAKCVGVSIVPAAACWALLSASGSPSHLEAPSDVNQPENPSVGRRDTTTTSVGRRETSGSPEDEAASAEWTPEGGGQRVPASRARARMRPPADGVPGSGQRALDRHATGRLVSRTSLHQQQHGDGATAPPVEAESVRIDRRRSTRQLQRRGTVPPAPPPVEADYRGSPCDRYNNLFHRVKWKKRRAACNGSEGCVFMGRSVTGSCVEREHMDQDYADPDADEYADDDDEDYYDDEDEDAFDDHEANMVETKLLATLVATVRQEGIEQPVRVLVTGSLADAMTDSMRTGQSVTEQLAKELLVEALEDPAAMLAIKHILHNDSLRASTRGLIYWLVREPWTVSETHKLLTWQLDYLLKDNRWTVQSLADTSKWLLGTQATEQAVKGLLKWCFDRDAKGPSYEPTVELVKSLAPGLEDLSAWGLQQSVHWALDDEYVRQLAKDSVKDLLLQRLSLFDKEKQAAAAGGQATAAADGHPPGEGEAEAPALDDEISPPTTMGEDEEESTDQVGAAAATQPQKGQAAAAQGLERGGAGAPGGAEPEGGGPAR